MEFLKIENLCKVYGKGENQVIALDHVSLTIQKGEFTAIIGSSGSGKSTLLHIIGGVDVPTSGKVYLEGQDVYAQNNEKLAIFRRRQVGLIYQFHNLIPTLNVVENITLPILMDKRKVNEERLNDLLQLLGLKDRKTHLPNQLSGGQQQRVSIGRSLMNSPAVMLADEPTGSLDSLNGHEIIKLLKESNKKYGQTLLLVTHDENIALQADRIIGISDGKVVRDERVRP
ncbi:ABC transporter ATP-binding protein [Clostridium estertheticum]|uniref:ABC transporter ATP-binding protein n=1 Tax=Clostridium estertheticum TaxID=238834 RepID=UPI001C7CC667|nr:ABC transporter ATP-binding protein [Clostridium estertheticum]MBX4271932.1 ABC transporter ATP-binding protein [Clostridium estertheticum]WLC82105.1 ABC transporter ATP-binding protein [Clostridium estertheticum]